MVHHLPELDRMSRALSRLETALLTNRPSFSASDGAGEDISLAEENRTLRLQCQEMRELLDEAHLILGDLLRLSGSNAQDAAPRDDSMIYDGDTV